MSPEERLVLLQIARSAVAASARDLSPPEPGPLPPALQEPGAAFVTLRRGGELRGCIGHIVAVDPLWKSVREVAAAAASRDSRFPPLRADEVAGLSIEISVLSPMRRARPEEVVVGTHGLYIKLRGRSGLLLPQVPLEWGWDGPAFLRHTCLKADLPPDAFLDHAAEIYTFTAEIFGEAQAAIRSASSDRSPPGGAGRTSPLA